MSTYGTIQDMVKRMKANEAHRKALQEHRRNLRKSYANTLNSQNPTFKKHDISEEDLEALKAKIRADLRNERKANRFKIVILGIVTLVLMGYFAYLCWTNPALPGFQKWMNAF